jgi:ferritin
MMNKKMVQAINRQINAELYSSYLYLSMAAYFQGLNLKGFANWLKVQALEEEYHALKFYGFLEDRAARPVLDAVAKPPGEWESPLEAFSAVLAHEQKVTGLINDLVDLAVKEKDHAANTMLQWFVNEQVEEEANATDIVEKLKLTGGQGAGLFMIDQELAARVFTVMPDVKVVITPAAGGTAP